MRHHSGNANPQLALIMVGSILALLFLFGAISRRKKKSANSSFYDPIDLASSKAMSQIERRKSAISRHISRLEANLASRKNQLGQHQQLTDVLTSRVETARQAATDEAEWDQLMTRGKEVYGDAWENPSSDGGLPLREIMELNKAELHTARSILKTERKKKRASKADLIARHNNSLLRSENDFTSSAASEIRNSSALVHPNRNQWSSTRQRASNTPTHSTPMTSRLQDDDNDTEVSWGKNNNVVVQAASPVGLKLPKLDFAQLGNNNNAIKENKETRMKWLTKLRQS